MRLRTYSEQDAEAVLALNQSHLDAVGPLDPKRLQWLVGLSERVLVADDGGAVAGFVVLIGPDSAYDSPNYRWHAQRRRALYLDRVVVAPTHRRRGVGTVLYDAAEEVAGPYGAMTLEVYAEPPNEGSLAFHARRGYVEVGRLAQEGGKVAAMLVKPFGQRAAMALS